MTYKTRRGPVYQVGDRRVQSFFAEVGGISPEKSASVYERIASVSGRAPENRTKKCARSDCLTLGVHSSRVPTDIRSTSTNSRQFVPVPANNSFRLVDTGEWTRYA